MSGFAWSGDDITLQPGPASTQAYQCPACRGIDWSPFVPMCDGTAQHPHHPCEAIAASEELAAHINQTDLPHFF